MSLAVERHRLAGCFVYAIRCRSSFSVYVGETRRPLHERLRAHRHALVQGIHGTPELQRAWDRRGEAAFEVKILETLESPHDLRVREAYWMLELHRQGWRLLNRSRPPGLDASDDPTPIRRLDRSITPDPTPEAYTWVSVEQARSILNLSASTIRRRIEAGTLVGEEIERAQGNKRAYRVRVLKALVEPPAPPAPPEADASEPEPDASRLAPEASSEIRRIAELSAYPELVALLRILNQPVEAHLEEMTTQLMRRMEEIATLREQLGRQGQRVDELAERASLAERERDELRDRVSKLGVALATAIAERNAAQETLRSLVSAPEVAPEPPDASTEPPAPDERSWRVLGHKLRRLGELLGYC